MKDGLSVFQNSRPHVVKAAKLFGLKIYFQTFPCTQISRNYEMKLRKERIMLPPVDRPGHDRREYRSQPRGLRRLRERRHGYPGRQAISYRGRTEGRPDRPSSRGRAENG